MFPMIALTATATEKVIKNIMENLQLNQPKVFKDSFSRSNIKFKVKSSEDKLYHLKSIVGENSGSTIIYVRSRRMTIFLSDYLNKNGFRATFFMEEFLRLKKKNG